MKAPQAPRLLLLVCALLGLLLSACGGTTTPPASNPTSAPAAQAPTTVPAEPTAAPAEPTAAPAEPAPAGALPAVISMPEQLAGGRPVTISVIGMPPESQPEALARWQEQVERFQQLYPNVTIVGSDYAYAPDTFVTLVAGNQVPTLFEVYLSDPGKIIDQGVAADLSSIFDAQGLRDVFNPNILAITSKDDKVYGIPRFAYAMGLGYNMAMLKQAGFDAPPTTWDQLAEMAKTLTKRDAGQSGFSFISDGGNATGWQATTIAYTFGAQQSDIVTAQADGSYVAGFASGAPVEALDYIKKLRWTDDVLPRENLDWGKNGEALATGRAAMVVMAGDQFTWIRTTFPDVDISQFGFAPLPAGPNGKSVSLVGGNIAMISSTASPDEQEAAAYYRLWTQFDPAELQNGYELSAQDPTVVVGAPTLPMYVGDYEQASAALMEQYANLPLENYALFRDAVTSGAVGLEPEPAVAGQEYYGAMGSVVSAILADQTTDPAAAIKEAAETFQQNVLNQLAQQK